MAAICNLGCLKTWICTSNCVYGSESQHASLCQILCWLVKSLLRYGDFRFLNGGHLPLFCYVDIWTTHDEYLVVLIIVQTLVRIDAVVSITCNCWYLTSLAWKCLFIPQMVFSGDFTPKSGAVTLQPAKGTPYAEARHMTYRSLLLMLLSCVSSMSCHSWSAMQQHHP